MKTKTVWVEVIMKTSEKVAVRVPAKLGGLSAKDEAEKIIANRPPSERLGPGSKHITWSYYAD